jgi:hypothetical protein
MADAHEFASNTVDIPDGNEMDRMIEASVAIAQNMEIELAIRVCEDLSQLA